MLRRKLIGLLIGCTSFGLDYLDAQPAGVDDDSIKRWLDFHHIWFKFLRDYFGCPPEFREFTIGECRTARGNLDYEAFNKARNLAKKIFDLEDKKRG